MIETSPDSKPYKLSTQIPRKFVYFCYPGDCGIGEAASGYQSLFRDVGFQVEVRPWVGKWEEMGGELDTIYFHHWHPQPFDIIPDFAPPGRHVAYWACEVSGNLPLEVEQAAPLFDEIWCPSNFCAETFSQFRVPLKVVPHVVEERPASREPAYDLRFHVVFWYDSRSRAARKNPDGAIRVFKRAFPGDHRAKLTIKGHYLDPAELCWLKFAARDDPRISIVNDFLEDEEYERLWDQTDCLLGLQRGEGFGFNIAKAIARGIPVVTTAWGGHVEFAEGVAELVGYVLEPTIALGDNWYNAGMWAEPSEDQAVELLRKVRSTPAREKLELGIKRIQNLYSREQIRKRIFEATVDWKRWGAV